MADHPLPSRRRIPDRIPIIDVLRAVSILAVVGFHFFFSGVSPGGYPPFLSRFFLKAFSNGAYGVPCFFAISGFVITRVLLGEGDGSRVDLHSFYIRRVSRIAPLLGLVLVGGVLVLDLYRSWDNRVATCFRNRTMHFNLFFWLSILTFTFNWLVVFRSKTTFFSLHWGVLWSLSVEEQFYLFYPLAVRGLRKRRSIAVLLGLMIFLGVAFRAWVFWYGREYPAMMGRASFGAFDQIALGGMGYLLASRIKDRLRNRERAALLLAFLGMVLFAAVYLGTDYNNDAQQVFAPTLIALGSVLMFWGGMGTDFFQGGFWKPWCKVGEVSYGGYLWHTMVLFLLWPLLASVKGPVALAVFLLTVWIGSTVSYRWFETPVNRWIRVRFAGEGTPAKRNRRGKTSTKNRTFSN
jgi:peptidoglycan/LPS O-acetylase OafA/YrhL